MVAELEEKHGNFVAGLEEKHKVEIVKLGEGHREMVAELEEKHKEEMIKLEEVHKKVVAELEENHTEVVAGLEAKQNLEEGHKEMVAELEKRHADFVAVLEEQHKAEMIKLEEGHKEMMTELEKRHAAVVAELEDQHKVEVVKLGEDHKEEVAKLGEQHKEEVAKLKEGHKEVVVRLGEQHKEEVTELGEKHKVEIVKLEEGHAAVVRELEKKNASLLDMVEENHKNEMSKLKEEHKESASDLIEKLYQKDEEVKNSNNKIEELTNVIKDLNDSIMCYKKQILEEVEKTNEYNEEINKLKVAQNEMKDMNDKKILEKENEIKKLNKQLSNYKIFETKESTYRNYEMGINENKERIIVDSVGKENISESDVEGKGGNLKMILSLKKKERNIFSVSDNKNENSELVDSIKSAYINKIEMYKKEIKDNGKNIEDLKNKILDMSNELINLENIKKVLTDENDNLKKEMEIKNNKLNEKEKNENTEILNLNDDIIKLKKDIFEWKNEEEKWTRENIKLKNDIEQINKEYKIKEETLMIKFNENINEVSSLKNQIEIEKTKLEELNKNYELLLAEKKEKNLSTPNVNNKIGENNMLEHTDSKENNLNKKNEDKTGDDVNCEKTNDQTKEISYLKDEIKKISMLYGEELNRKNSYDEKVKNLTNELKELKIRNKKGEEAIAELNKLKNIKEKNKSVKKNDELSNSSIIMKEGDKDIAYVSNDDKMQKNWKENLVLKLKEKPDLWDNINSLEKENFRVMSIVKENKNMHNDKIVGVYSYFRSYEKELKNDMLVICLVLKDILSVLFLNDNFVNLFEKVDKILWKQMYIPKEIKIIFLRYFNFLDKLRNYVKCVNEEYNNNERYDDSWALFQTYLETASNLKKEMIYYVLEKAEKDSCENSSSNIDKTKISDILNFSKDSIRLKTIAQLRKELNFERQAKNILNYDYQIILNKYHECLRKLKIVKNMAKELDFNYNVSSKFSIKKELEMCSDENDELKYNNIKDNEEKNDSTKDPKHNNLIKKIINLQRNKKIEKKKNNLGNEINTMYPGDTIPKGKIITTNDNSKQNEILKKKENINNNIIHKNIYTGQVKNIFNEPVERKVRISFVHKSPFS
ncbi:hypothetical protein YYE_04590 [Plasmodium vinckei vinckei]|nr:hypothetical protein YYE_04590 [Plasmodium vinckei vinckei]